MKNIIRHLALLIACMSFLACTRFTPYREPVEVESLAAMKEFPVSRDAGLEEPDSVQHRTYDFQFRAGEGKDEQDPVMAGDYYLSFVEFDDQGWFANRKQMDALLTLLDRLEKEDPKRETLIYVFAHGWMHNASPGDSNVVYFSRLLERTDVAERMILHDGGKELGRAVVGVYCGWRGLPCNASYLTNFSFWNRKDTAARVGRGGIYELLVRLNDYRERRQREMEAAKKAKEPTVEADALPTQLIITGHSFGGLVIYSALSHALMERAVKAKRKAPDGPADLDLPRVEGFGDFVMLVNPAFEGSLYEPLYQIAVDSEYDPKQRPVMMIVTSKADAATRVAFPVGQTLGTLFQHTNDSYQSASLRETIGHNESYRTHDLDFQRSLCCRNGWCAEQEGEEPEEGDGPYPLLGPTAEWDLLSLLDRFTAEVEPDKETGASSFGPGVSLKPVSYRLGDPFLIVSADEHVIANHNAIYNERFVTFAQLFLWRYVQNSDQFQLAGSPVTKEQE